MPFDRAEKMPSAAQTRNAKLMSVIVPRAAIAPSMIWAVVSASSGVPLSTVSIDELAGRALAHEEGQDDHGEHDELEQGQHRKVGHAAGVLQALVLEEPLDGSAHDTGPPPLQRPAINASDQPLNSFDNPIDHASSSWAWGVPR